MLISPLEGTCHTLLHQRVASIEPPWWGKTNCKKKENRQDASPRGRRDLRSSGMLSRVWWSGQPNRSIIKVQEIQNGSR